MKKNYVLDTNVLLHDPNAIRQFEDNTVVIPIGVIEEIDQFKRDLSELGRNARHVSRMLDEMRGRGKLSDGVALDHGGALRVALVRRDQPPRPHSGYADREILQLALEMRQQAPATPTVVVSKDINLRIKADSMGIAAEDYETDRVDINELYLGFSELELPPEGMAAFERSGSVPFEGQPRPPNEYLHLRDTTDAQHTLLGRLDPHAREIHALIPPPRELASVRPKNKEQCFAMDALLDERIKLVTIIGKAGTGKTLLAVAAGLFNTLERKLYRKLLVSRPTMPMGKDIGYLPGTVTEKLNPWMQPIFDALDLLYSGRDPQRKGPGREAIETNDHVSVEPLSFIRGRSIHNQFMIVDEAQNLTPLEVKTIVTRVGHGSKIVLTGDIYQIDNPYVDSTSNGLSIAVGRFREHGIAAHISLAKGVRSDLAELAANVL
jgi:PhoH-like ATPase